MSDATLLSRRSLLRSVALVVGGSLLAACQSASSPPANAPSGPPPTKPAAPPAATTAPAPAATSAPAAAPTTAANAAPAVQAGAPSLTIGAVMGLTGRYASLTEQVKNGYELAFDDLNKTSKLQLQLKMLDDESDPTKTVQRLESLNSSDNPLALLGGAGSDLHAAAAAVADKNKTPYIGVAFALLSVHQRGLKYLFSPFPKSPQIAITTFNMLDSLSPKPTKVATFHEKTDWGSELSGLWKQEAQKRGYEVVADEEYTPGANDYSALILKAKGANADALLSLPTPPDGMAMAKQMKELDFLPKMTIFIRASDSLVWSQNLGKDGDYVLNAPGWSPQLKFPGVAQVVSEHQAKYNKSAEALTGAAYSAVQVLFDAVNRVGKADRDALRDALAATNLTTVAGPVKFDADGTAPGMINVFNQWLAGKQVLVWPKDQATQAPDYPAKPWPER
jgi:branched-chain amino acid transport system substrate-binding protein